MSAATACCVCGTIACGGSRKACPLRCPCHDGAHVSWPDWAKEVCRRLNDQEVRLRRLEKMMARALVLPEPTTSRQAAEGDE